MFVGRFSIKICLNISKPVNRGNDVKKRDRSKFHSGLKVCQFERFKFAILSRRDDDIKHMR